MLAAPLLTAALLGVAPPAAGNAKEVVAEPGAVILHDEFDRAEKDDAKEQVGGGWGTNSKSRAKGNKQVDLVERDGEPGGAIHITMHPEADHGVSVRHDAPTWTDGTLTLDFKLPAEGKGDLGIDLADLQDKTVHAGHLLLVRVWSDRVLLLDHKHGGMDLARRDRRQANALTAADKRVMKETRKLIKRQTAPGEWHTLTIKTAGDVLSVSIDGEPVGELKSPGIGHPTKRTVRIAVNSECWVDDLKLVADTAPAAPSPAPADRTR